MKTVRVEVPGRPYDVHIGPGASNLLSRCMPEGASRAAVVTQDAVGFEIDPAMASARFVIPDGEQAKSFDTVEELCRSFARAGLARSDVVVAVGGGVVTDVAGFAAAVYQRGIAYVNVATTLLAQVDAAIGGKTGVNIEEGKNFAGAIWQPAAVLCDTDALETLPRREWLSGRGEMAKCSFLGALLRPEASAGPNTRGASEGLNGPTLEEQIASCVAIKAAVVSVDEREGGQRALLNYGHTLAHALEGIALRGDAATLDLRHGEAVAIGLMFAALLARRLGRIDDDRVRYHRQVLDSMELPSALPDGVSARELVDFMSRDKKSRHDLTFVLDGPGGVELVRGVPQTDVLATLADMGCAA